MMYYKIINGQYKFSECKSVLNNDGCWISNPTPEQIAEAGWLEYIPPEIVPQPQTEPDFQDIVSAIKTMLSTQTEELSDEDALGVAVLFPTWNSKIDKAVHIGERLWYDGKLYKVIQDHTIQSDWTPDTVPGLYTEVSILEWPEWVQPTGAQDAYMTGDKVTFESRHYVSIIDNNTWSPAAYPQGWEEMP